MNASTLTHAPRHNGRPLRDETRRTGPGRLVRRLFDALYLSYERHRQQEMLARLNDRLLDDVGLSRDEAIQVSRGPFWRL